MKIGLALAALAAGALLCACGKKGPPLPPLPGSVPRITDLAVTQVGGEARATFTLPVRPEREEVDYVLIALELWRKEVEEPTVAPAAPRAGAPVTPAPRPRSSSATPFTLQGPPDFDRFGAVDNGPPVSEYTEGATLVATATGDALFDVLKAPVLQLVDALPATPAAPYFEYAVVLKTDVRKKGTVSNLATIAATAPLPAPTGLAAEVAEGAITLSWTAPAPPAPSEAPAEGEAAPASYAFNVYRARGDEPLGATPLNSRPLSDVKWTDKEVVVGEAYRYAVRTVVATELENVESAATPEASVTYTDTFAPATPGGLRLILEGRRAVNLLWNPSPEADLGGYGVWRREPGGTWERLDAGAPRTATWTDRTVVAGRTYEYAVSAFDRATPPNESARSAPDSVDIPAEEP